MPKNYSNDEIDKHWVESSGFPDPGSKLHDSLDSLYAEGPPPEALQKAAAMLAQRLEAELGPVIFYGEIPQSPVGRVFIAEGPTGVVALDFDLSEAEFTDQIRERGYKRLVKSDNATKTARREISQYLAGKLLEFSLASDLTGLTQFQQDVLLAAAKVPRGRVTTYGEIARSLGKPKSSRAVGRALGSNPIPLIIPCHRVIGSDGSLRGYSGGGGIRSKAYLLELEGAMMGGL